MRRKISKIANLSDDGSTENCSSVVIPGIYIGTDGECILWVQSPGS